MALMEENMFNLNGSKGLGSDVSCLIDTAISRKRVKGYDRNAFPQVSDERFKDLKTAFIKFDKDKLGFIAMSKLPLVFEELKKGGLEEKELKQIMASADPTKKGIITFSKFVILAEINQNPIDYDILDMDNEDRKKAFSLFEHSGTGFIKFSNLVNALDYLGIKASKEDMDGVLDMIKNKHEGKLIEYEDFCYVIEQLEKKQDDVLTNLSGDKVNEIKEVFDVFDDKKTGSILTSELPFVLKCLKMETPEEEIHEILIANEIEGDEIKFQQYMHIVERKLKDFKDARDGNKLTEDERRELQEAFALFDVDGDGTISISELRTVLQSLGRKLSYKKLKNMIDGADADGNGFVDFEELVSLMELYSLPFSFLDEMKKAFRHFDKDGNGFISPGELKRALERMKIKLGRVQFLLMLKRVDTDKDGQISFKEFVVMMLNDQNI